MYIQFSKDANNWCNTKYWDESPLVEIFDIRMGGEEGIFQPISERIGIGFDKTCALPCTISTSSARITKEHSFPLFTFNSMHYFLSNT